MPDKKPIRVTRVREPAGDHHSAVPLFCILVLIVLIQYLAQQEEKVSGCRGDSHGRGCGTFGTNQPDRAALVLERERSRAPFSITITLLPTIVFVDPERPVGMVGHGCLDVEDYGAPGCSEELDSVLEFLWFIDLPDQTQATNDFSE